MIYLFTKFGKNDTNKLSTQGFDTIIINDFIDIPNVLTQIQTFNGYDWVITRTTSITNNSFDLTMQEEE